ncbi:hypothetical protein PIB30_000411, partial [Stylosanthes scabra]|nr:hypothetical protein [Stylosanthes scabra]
MPSCMKTWKAKQKTIALMYGDWEESYAEIPPWVIGVQLTMPGSVAILKKCPARVGGEVDES